MGFIFWGKLVRQNPEGWSPEAPHSLLHTAVLPPCHPPSILPLPPTAQLIRFSGCKGGEACTVVLRGASQYMLDEAERSLHDALCVVAQTLKVWGPSGPGFGRGLEACLLQLGRFCRNPRTQTPQ